MKQVPRRQYTAEFKLGAAELADSVGVTEAARRLDVPDSSLCNWIKRKREGKLSPSSKASPVNEEQAELSRLRKENAQLKLDNEILRKATAYFAKEPR
jgi:transposase